MSDQAVTLTGYHVTSSEDVVGDLPGDMDALKIEGGQSHKPVASAEATSDAPAKANLSEGAPEDQSVPVVDDLINLEQESKSGGGIIEEASKEMVVTEPIEFTAAPTTPVESTPSVTSSETVASTEPAVSTYSVQSTEPVESTPSVQPTETTESKEPVESTPAVLPTETEQAEIQSDAKAKPISDQKAETPTGKESAGAPSETIEAAAPAEAGKADEEPKTPKTAGEKKFSLSICKQQ